MPDSRRLLEDEEEEESPNATLDHPPRPGHLQPAEVPSDRAPNPDLTLANPNPNLTLT